MKNFRRRHRPPGKAVLPEFPQWQTKTSVREITESIPDIAAAIGDVLMASGPWRPPARDPA